MVNANAGAETDKWTLIHAGTLLAVPGQRALKNQTIITKNNLVYGVYEGYVGPDTVADEATAVEIIDLKDKFVLPGLMDVHTHLTLAYSGARPDGFSTAVLSALQAEADLALEGAANARKTLDAGFTTVRNVGGPGRAAIALRDAIKAGKVPGPRMFVAGGFISISSGHGDLDGVRDDLYELIKPDGICDGRVDCRRAIRTQVRRGADFIKIMATGGGGEDDGAKDSVPEYSAEEMRDMVLTAHNLGRKVAAHAHGTRGIVAALQAGVDSVEHATYLDDQAIELFKSSGAYLVPTLSVLNVITNMELPQHLQQRVATILDEKPQSMAMAYQQGVKMALGTDAGVVPHGSNAAELLWFTRIGMSAMEAIKAATINAAELIGVAERLGTLETGKYADIIAVQGNPLEDVGTLSKVDFVMKNGKVYKR